jgi:hypothetical protein
MFSAWRVATSEARVPKGGLVLPYGKSHGAEDETRVVGGGIFPTVEIGPVVHSTHLDGNGMFHAEAIQPE